MSSRRRHVTFSEERLPRSTYTVPPSLLTAPDEVIERDIEFVTCVPLSREPICLLLAAVRFGGVLSVAWRRLGRTMTASVVMSPFPERRYVWTLVVRRTFHRNCLDAAMHSPLPQRVKRCGASQVRRRSLSAVDPIATTPLQRRE